MKDLLAELGDRLAELAGQGLARRLSPPAGIDFSSNDYLGYGRDKALWDALALRLALVGEPPSAPASRLLRGHTPLHAAVEERLARFKGTEAALLFPSGYQANVGLLTALVGPDDRAVTDAQNHASLIDGLRLSGCRKVIVRHLSLPAVEKALARPYAKGRTFLVTESLFSMDGDQAPLAAYADLAERYGASLIVDEAHATGLYGERGSGLLEEQGVERRVTAVVSTLGKAFGLAGAFVAGPQVVIDYLVNRCRPFVFSTAISPLLLHGVDLVLDRIAAEPERRARALTLADRLRLKLRTRVFDFLRSEGPIVPVILGDNRRAVAVAEALQARGFDVRAIRPPTVAPGSARLRISVHADRTEAEIDALADALWEVAK